MFTRNTIKCEYCFCLTPAKLVYMEFSKLEGQYKFFEGSENGSTILKNCRYCWIIE